MIRVVLFVIAIFILLFIFSRKNLNKKIKIYIAIIFAIIVVGSILYENFISKKTYEHRDEIMRLFLQGKSVFCDGVEVNNTNFGISYATSTFISKKNASSKFKDLMFDIQECKNDR